MEKNESTNIEPAAEGDASELSGLISGIEDVIWRLDDTTEQLQGYGPCGDRLYGLDEFSGPIRNLKMAMECLRKLKMQTINIKLAELADKY